MSSLSTTHKADLEALCDHLPDGVVILDSVGRILYNNRVFLQMLGHKSEKIIGESLRDLLLPEDEGPLLEFIGGQGASKTFPEIRLNLNKGPTIICEITLKGFDTDTGRHVAIFIKKDTERQSLRNALAECETKFKTFFQSAAVYVYFTTEDGKIVDINDAALRLLGYSREELSALTALDLYVDPREREYCVAKIKQQGFVQDCPIHLRRKDGKILSCLDSTVLMEREKGQPALYQGILRDITVQEQLQNALAESEAEYRGFFESAPVFAYLTSRDGNLLETNEAGSRLFGYSTQELRQMNVATLYKDPDDRRLFSEKMRKNGSVVDYPVLLKRKEGRIISGRITASARKISGEIIGYQGFIRDVTEQEHLQNALIENEKKFRGFFENSAVFAYITDKSGNLIDVNSAALKLLGYSREEISELKAADLYDDVKEREQFIKEIEQQGFVKDLPIRLKRKSGKVLSLRDTAILIRDQAGHPVMYQGIIRDVTEQERLENERRKLVTLLTQTDAEIVITDTRGTIEYVNPAFEKITGYSAAEAKGENPRVLKSGRHDETFYKNLWATITAGKPWSGRFVNKRKDGSLYHEAAHIFPIFDGKGTIQNFAAIKRDITQEVTFEEQIQQASQMEAIGRLTGGVAHDFNNVLTIIRGNVETVLKDLGPGDLHYEEIADILKASQQATRVTSQLLAFSRQQIIRPAILSANYILKTLHTTLNRIIGEDIDFQYALCETGDTILADRGQIEQCILNLVVNAQDAIRQKEVGKERKIIIETRSIFVDAAHTASFPSLPEGAYVVISVRDTGLGMDKETREKVFEPFFTTKGPERGTGLGCSTVFGIVKQNGGVVQVTSEPGQGSTFTIYWPAAVGNPSTEKTTRETPSKPVRGKETILVAEDDPDILKFVSQTLESFGYTVYSAGDGKEALALVRDNKLAIDLLFTDVIMPKIGGEELAEVLTRELPQLKVIFSSGYTDKHITRNGILGPNTHFLHKPYGLKALSLKVREVLDKVQ